MIPPRYLLTEILTNKPLIESSVKETEKPWQAYFTELNIETLQPDIDLFSWKYDDSYDDDLSPLLFKIDLLLGNYYRDYKKEEGVTPDRIFSFLADFANNGDLSFVFKNYYGEDHTIQWIIKKEIERWHLFHQDALYINDESYPDTRFSLEVEKCLLRIGDIKW